MKISKEKFEELAALEHRRWSDWYTYMREKMCDAKLKYWDTLSDIPYSELSENSKDSDRSEVMRYLKLLNIEVEE